MEIGQDSLPDFASRMRASITWVGKELSFTRIGLGGSVAVSAGGRVGRGGGVKVSEEGGRGGVVTESLALSSL